MKYYLIENDTKCGPFTLDELQQKEIQRETPMWTRGLDDWTEARNIPMLKEILEQTPPTFKKKNTVLPPPPPTAATSRNTEKYHGYNLASRWERFLASLIGGLIIFVPVAFVTKGDYFLQEDFFSPTSIIVDLIVTIIIGGLMYPLWNGNLGHKIFGLKVISLKNGKDIKQPTDGIIREFLKYIFSYFILPIIWLLWDKDKQNLYDKAVSTVVVKKKEG